MKLYLVQSETGSYEDYRTTPLTVFLTEQEVNEHIEYLKKAYKHIDESNYLDISTNELPYSLDVDYTGIDFYWTIIDIPDNSQLYNMLKSSNPELFI